MRLAWSLALLNVLWQHLVEQRKNCTESWLQHLYPLFPSQLRISNGTGLQQESWASEALPLGWHQHYAGLISAAFLFHFIKQKAKAAALPGVFLA